MTIRIVTDSTCDLPPELSSEYGISVVPMTINFGNKGFLDGVELTRDEFYENLPKYETHPTTGTQGPDAFQKVYERLAAEGATEILSIHVSSSLSAVLGAARLGAKQTAVIPVTVVDSRQLSLGTGFAVLAAAKASAEGHSMSEILSIIDEQISRTHVFAALDTLEFLRRSGRMNGILTGLGSLLQLKPILKMYEGNATSEKVRTTHQAHQRLIELLKEKIPLERIALVHANAPDKAEKLRRKVADILPKDGILSVNITPVIGAHVGPGAVGFALIGGSNSSHEGGK